LGTTLQAFADDFGMESFIGKRAVVFSDANVDGLTARHMARIAERLKNISGEDAQHINRKRIRYWEGTLSVRVIVFANELLRFTDDSTALASRFVTVQMNESFYGREDKELTTKLLAERSGILNLALGALDRLRERGCPLQPAAGLEMGEDLARLSSDVAAFLQDCCELGREYSELSSRLFEGWSTWCDERGVRYGWGQSQFTAKLKAAASAAGGKLKQTRSRDDGPKRPPRLCGIRVLPE
jgi:putative DNA primase/helicase